MSLNLCFNLFPISRLVATWRQVLNKPHLTAQQVFQVPPKILKIKKKLTTTLSPTNNFNVYRTQLEVATATPPFVPCLGKSAKISFINSCY